MDRCREIYQRILSEGISAIDGFIADRKSEELFMDFKRSSNNGATPSLSDIDRQNLAKAISGFGNSEGGVIVWGVDCSRDSDGADVARAKVPLENPKRFASILQGVISGCTIPPHSTVENHHIEEQDGKGYVLTLIPKSDFSPHQMIPKKQYYIRAGSDFVPTPHDVLAGMFGRRPQPHVFHHFILGIPTLESNILKINLGIAIGNSGPGIASDIFTITLIENLPGPKCTAEFEPTDKSYWTGGWEFQRKMSLISMPGYRLPPSANVQPVVMHLSLAKPFDSELKISGSVGSGQSRRYEFIIESPKDNIQRNYELFLKNSTSQNFSTREKHQIGNEILNIKK